MYVKMLIALIIVLHIHAVTCHVRLTFPQARYPPLDFLDNARTTPPCGVPKPPPELGIRTSLKAGSTFNVTWSLAYPHQGGFRIEILDSDDQVRHVLTPEKQHYTGEDNPTAHIYQVTLPREECENCAIRLMRQAAEWSEGYQFWSCADVNILIDPKEKCSHHGKFENDRCQCDKLFSGPFCQYEEECSIDDDCGGISRGKCQELESNSYPTRVCFCQPGYFGPKCLEESPLKTVNFDPTLYESKAFGEEQQNKLFWRILEESSEIEMIMQYPSHTWIALGWKPEHLSAQCADLHTIIEKYYNHYPISSGKSTNEAERKVLPKPVLEQRSKSDNMTTKAPFLTPEPVTKNPESPTNSIETLSDLQTSSTAKPFKQSPETSVDIVSLDIQSTPTQIFQFSTISPSGEDSDDEFSFSVLQGQGQSSAPNVSKPAGPYPPGGLKPLNEQEPEVIGDACYGEWRWPPNCRDCDYKLSWTYIDENDEIEFSLETKAGDNAWSGVGFSSNGQMNGADFLIIKAMGGKLTIQDAYGANSQTPQLDQQQNLKSSQVVGTHVNGVLRAAFSRPRKTTDTEHDVQFTNADCFYFLFPTSSGNVDKFGKLSPLIFPPKISRQQVCIKTCNPSGTSVPVRKSCDDTFKFPPGCRFPACDYMASWSYNPALDIVNFTISARELGRWTGIGFSKDGHM
uniref:Uncharacterized protein n=1 Tax=Romanomermis culicivorax TaxID=13658 RepID=A0A915IMZ1_ROMCU